MIPAIFDSTRSMNSLKIVSDGTAIAIGADEHGEAQLSGPD